LVDDAVGKTLTTVSSAKVAVKGKETFRKVVEATKVGETIGAFAKKAGIAKVVFDRGGFRFTGRVKAVADGARAAGLEF
jgi:large subunit ribosomal protein L18